MRRQSLLLLVLLMSSWVCLSAQTVVASEASFQQPALANSSSLTVHVVTVTENAVEAAKEDGLVAEKSALALALPTRVSISQRCDQGSESAQACSFNWRPALMQSVRFLAIQHALNTPTYRGTLKGPFFRDWFTSVKSYRYTRWSDDDPFIVDYIGHPMMGAVTGRIQVQNDPRGVSLEFGKSKAYWKSRAKALAFTAVYTAQWELGPVSETSIGNLGSFQYYSESAGHLSNGTGTVDLVMTPVGGTAWLIGEDILDKYAIQRLERVSNKKLWLLGISVLNPTRSVGNLLRMKTPWHRDTRMVGGAR